MRFSNLALKVFSLPIILAIPVSLSTILQASVWVPSQSNCASTSRIFQSRRYLPSRHHRTSLTPIRLAHIQAIHLTLDPLVLVLIPVLHPRGAVGTNLEAVGDPILPDHGVRREVEVTALPAPLRLHPAVVGHLRIRAPRLRPGEEVGLPHPPFHADLADPIRLSGLLVVDGLSNARFLAQCPVP